ncbi:MAG: MFS transporter [Vibrio hibernica]
MWLFGSLLTLGVNQTLLIALLPQIAMLFDVDAQSNNLGLIAIAINVNLVSYWIGSGLWGKYLHKMSLLQAYFAASLGYILCHILFISALFHVSEPQLWLAALSRFGLGLFSSAFMPIGQTYLAHKQPPALNKLSQLSGMATLGRLLGPTLVFLPLSLPTMLLLTLIPVLMSLLLIKWFVKDSLTLTIHQKVSHKTIGKTSAWQLAKHHQLTFITACLTTMLVAVYQLMLIPYLGQLGFNDQKISHYLAMLMLGISLLMIINQLWLIPHVVNFSNITWHSIFWSLLVTAALLIFTQHHLTALVVLSVTLTIALSTLPAWYSKQLLSIQENKNNTSQLSGLLAQSHSSGHLIGTGFASLFLYLHWNIEYLLLLSIAILLICTIQLRRKHRLSAPSRSLSQS